MSGEALNLVRSATIVWRHKILAGTIVGLGLVGNTAWTVAQPQVYTASALVVLSPPPASAAQTAAGQSPSVDVTTQTVVVTSEPVLSAAMRAADLRLSVTALRNLIQVSSAGPLTVSVSAQGDTARQAERTANAVTDSYIAYSTAASNPGGRQPAGLLQPATTAIAKPRTTRVYQAAGAGGLVGALIAVIVVLAIGRNDRRLRERDAIADSIGVPVLAAVRARCPRDAAGWAKLLASYAPGATDAWLLGGALRHVGLLRESGRSGTGSIAVLSLSADRDALALGPQLAVYTAAQGIPAALLVGAGHDSTAMAALRAACRPAAARNPASLQLMVSDHEDVVRVPAHSVTIAVDVVDARAPQVAGTARADVTVLAVTAGAVTAEQLVRVAAAAAAAGRTIAGIFVANPEPRDQTTGRLPQLARSERHRMPTRMVGVATESGR